jgi:hypothetical protein
MRDLERTDQNQETTISSQQSSTLAVVDPVTKRVVGLLRGLTQLYGKWERRDFMARQIKVIMEALIEEVEEDDKQLFSSGPAQLWMLNFAKLMEWTVTGDYEKLPEELVALACQIEGKPIPENAHPGLDA